MRDTDSLFEDWLHSLRDLTGSRELLESWQERRFAFAHRVANALVGPPGSPEITGPVLYGVYLSGSRLVYIGQTLDANRRLRDLLIGESHHLANTVPPELWERVVVVRWPELLDPADLVQIAVLDALPKKRSPEPRNDGLAVCGLALEHHLQLAHRPPLNSRRREAAGVWKMRNLTASKSAGAASAPRFARLCREVHDEWETLGTAPGLVDSLICEDLGPPGRMSSCRKLSRPS
ncbi:hypothetical protein AB0M43_37845, partial [Longispora sp. NPDC051575]|uniref:hypothetical protein n=1 Tax=Longispora sp. NPDC051575 TaxID=3154943 RepID=UPI00343D389C